VTWVCHSEKLSLEKVWKSVFKIVIGTLSIARIADISSGMFGRFCLKQTVPPTAKIFY